MFAFGNVELPCDGTKFKQILQELSDLEALPVECLGRKDNSILSKHFAQPYKVEEPHLILSRCAGTVCSASHISWKPLTEGLPCWVCWFLSFVFCESFGCGSGFCRSACAACPTWVAAHSDGRLSTCSLSMLSMENVIKARTHWLPGLMCSRRGLRFILTHRMQIRFQSASKRLLGTIFKSSQDFKACVTVLDIRGVFLLPIALHRMETVLI